MNSDSALLARSENGASIAALQRLFTESTPVTRNGWHRIEDAEDARFCVWPGQSPDGRKWDENSPDGNPVRPFNGASDFRPLVTDDAIQYLKNLLMQAARRSLRADGGGDPKRGAHLRRYLNYLTRQRLIEKVWPQIELFANHYLTYPLAALHVCWRFEIGWRWQTATLQDIQMIEQAAQGALDGLGDAILDPTQATNAAGVVQAIYDSYARAKVPDWAEIEVPKLSLTDARRVVKELREDGRTRLRMPYVCANHAELEALKPWEEFIVPEWACDTEHAPVFLKFYLTQAQLEQTAKAENWNEEFTKQVLDRPGLSVWHARQRGLIWQEHTSLDEEQFLFEVVYAYRKMVDADGVTGVYETVFHTQITGDETGEELFGRHELLEDARGKVPVVVARFEVIDKQLTSGRSLPEILQPTQSQVKQHIDLTTNRTAFTTMPPIIQYQSGTLGYQTQQEPDEFGPGARMKAVSQGREPKFMDVSGGTAVESLKLIELMTFLLDRRVGRRRPDAVPDEAIATLEEIVSRFLCALSEAFQQMIQLTAQYLPAADWQRIVGEDAEPLPSDPETIGRELDFLLEFDTRALNPEFMEAQLKVIAEIAQQDRTGRFNWGEWMTVAIEAVNPSLAKRLVLPDQQATEQLRRGVKDDIAHMRAGILPDLVENDASAPVKLQFAQSIIESSPDIQQALTQDEGFAERMTQYAKNLTQSAQQLGENKLTGRLGVASNAQVQAPMPG
jgi:hypothetical protein